MDTSKYKALFLQEAADHIAGVEDGLLTLESDPTDKPTVDELFRHYHSLKGMCASMGYEPMQRLAHVQEDLLDSVRGEGKPAPTQSMTSTLLECLDVLREMASRIEADKPMDDIDLDGLIKMVKASSAEEAEAPPASPEAKAGEAPSPATPTPETPATEVTAPAPVETGADGEAATPAEAPTPTPPETPQAEAKRPTITPDRRRAPDKLGERPIISDGTLKLPNTMKVDGAVFDDLLRVAGDLLTHLSKLRSTTEAKRSIKVKESVHDLGKSIEELRESILDARMIPFSDLSHSLPRIVRDVSKKKGKEVELQIRGGEISLDKSILEKMGDPLVHIIRNAVDHGIEMPNDRVTAEKPGKGRVRVSAATKSEMVAIVVEDDGAGIDAARLKEKAISKGIDEESVRAMDDKEALMLICHPGLSLASAVTDVSGRGVGMDVVKDTVEKLGGTLLIESVIGKGTRFTMELPRAASIMKVLLVRSGAEVFSLSVNRVVKVMEVDEETASKNTFEYLGQPIPLMDLSDTLSFKSKNGARESAVVAVLSGVEENEFAGVVFDDFIDEIDAYIKPLRPPFTAIWGVNGLSILGDGRPVFFLDVSQLTEKIRTTHLSGNERKNPH